MNEFAIRTYPVFSFNFIRAYIITMRPYLMFVSGITGVAGISFSTELSLLKTLIIFIAAFLSYGFGQALTDCFQVDTDSISSPYRPLTKGVVHKNHFIIISSLGLFFCISVFAYFKPLNLLPGIFAGFGLATYTYFKRKWWGGPFYNSWIVVVLFIMAYLAGTDVVIINLLNPAFLPAIIIVFFGYANFVLAGYFKDIDADRITGYNTLPVRYGRRISSIISDLFCIIASAALLYAIYSFAVDLFLYKNIIKSLLFAAAGISTSILTQVNLHLVKTDAEAHRAIVPCVHSYILLLSSIAVLNKPGWFVPLMIFYLAYIIVLKIRPAKEQI